MQNIKELFDMTFNYGKNVISHNQDPIESWLSFEIWLKNKNYNKIKILINDDMYTIIEMLINNNIHLDTDFANYITSIQNILNNHTCVELLNIAYNIGLIMGNSNIYDKYNIYINTYKLYELNNYFIVN